MSKGSVYGSFVQALIFSSSIAVPKYFLNHYSQLCISHIEALLIIQIMSELESNAYPSSHILAQRMNLEVAQVEEMLEHLLKQDYLSLDTSWNPIERKMTKGYSLVGLIDQLADLWALDQIRQGDTKQVDVQTPAASVIDQAFGKIILSFEQELARPITAIECEVIEGWIGSKFSEELILGAFKRAVLAGIRNFRYVDSILREWDKKGLRTLYEVENNDAEFQARHEKSKRNKQQVLNKKNDKYQSTSEFDDLFL